MHEKLLELAGSDLGALAAALRSGRLTAPFSAASVGRFVSNAVADGVAGDLGHLADLGLGGLQVAAVLDLLVQDRAQHPRLGDSIDLVTTGPEAPGITNRDTSVVVREMFAHAQDSVLVAGYAVYQGRQVFQALADRMQERPGLKVRLFLDVQRGPGNSSLPSEIIRGFAERFKTQQWPAGAPMPQVYFDPRSLAPAAEKRACLHAKCIVVDRAAVFISSANFTEAAHERNIEVGLLVRSAPLAERVERHFEALLGPGMLQEVPLLHGS